MSPLVTVTVADAVRWKGPEVTVTMLTYVPTRLIRTRSSAWPFAFRVPVTGCGVRTPDGPPSAGPAVVAENVAPA